jgi:hypothetical protein
MKWIEGALLKNDERVAMRNLQKMKDSLNKRRLIYTQQDAMKFQNQHQQTVLSKWFGSNFYFC